jgi:hypothetical protein
MSGENMTANYWLGVVSKDHVMIGVKGSFAQVCHGKLGPLKRLKAGDGFVYYSPTVGLGERTALQAFTAIGRVGNDEPFQVTHTPDFRPWRRTVNYQHDIGDVPVSMLRDELDLTSTKNWGYALRRGLLPLTSGDFARIERAMQSVSVL